ncbi:MAG: YggT family protein [Candidatus Promineifilaceae bacterium]
MTTHTDERTLEVKKEVRRDYDPHSGDEFAVASSRHQEMEVVDAHGSERTERVVENVGAERQIVVTRIGQFIWLLTGILEALIGLRVVLKLIAANPNNPFAQLIYDFTNFFLWPFQGLTATPSASNGMTLEISSLIAMVVYAIAAWVIVKLIYLAFSPTSTKRVTVYRREED